MTVKDPMSLRSNLYIAAAGAAPWMRSLAEGSQEMPARASKVFWRGSTTIFRHTSADRMAMTSLAFGAERPGVAPALRERLIEIRDQVFDVLDAHRQPHQAVADSQARADLRRQRRVRHDRRMLGEAFDAAQALRANKDAATFEQAARVVESAFQDQRHHAAEAVHLPARERMLRMIGQTRVMHVRDFGMRDQPTRDRERILAVPRHTQVQRFEPA